MAATFQKEGNGEETVMNMEDSTEDEISDGITEEPNRLEPDNNVKCLLDKCIRPATKFCGKCEGKICDIHVGAFSKQYTVVCQLCHQQKLSQQYDNDKKCVNQCKRIMCNKCTLIIIALLVLMVILAIGYNSS